MNKTILMGVSIPIVVVVAIYAMMDNIQRTNQASDIMNANRLFQDLKEGKITAMQYCEHKTSDEQQKVCTEYKNKFGIK
jgi:hypothetical protein